MIQLTEERARSLSCFGQKNKQKTDNETSVTAENHKNTNFYFYDSCDM